MLNDLDEALADPESLTIAHKTRKNPVPFPYASVVTLAFGFVTLTPNCFALEMISILFLDETACPILPVEISQLAKKLVHPI